MGLQEVPMSDHLIVIGSGLSASADQELLCKPVRNGASRPASDSALGRMGTRRG